jgi:hypothetical protein
MEYAEVFIEATLYYYFFSGFKFYPSLSGTVNLRASTRYKRSIFNVCSSRKNCPALRRASTANVVSKDVYIFKTKHFFLSIIFYNCTFIIIKVLTIFNILPIFNIYVYIVTC